ncbi:transporter substrate-binding domain-containing protein [Chitinimonas sp. BJB300]|uniref:substrate-binding periplasmic protein n=2 Tax=Chitinimonas sp. BJB300 TaxID=1559339 RepID=UPI001C8FE0E5
MMRPSYTLLRYLCLALTLIANGFALAETTLVKSYNTYLFPPFVTNNGGLAVELVNYLNQKLANEYRFQLFNVPRSRLVRGPLKDETSLDGIVLFLNPRFVDDANQQHFLWTPALFSDSNVLVFRGPTAPIIKDLKALQGMRFGAVLENRYRGIDELTKARTISRIDGTSELNNLKLLQANRIDFTLMGLSTFTALSRDNLIDESLATSPPPDDPAFTRHILVNKKQPELAKRLFAIVTNMASDPYWQDILERYQLELKHH